MDWSIAKLFSAVEQEMKCWLNWPDIEWSNFEENNKYVIIIIIIKLTEIPNSFKFFSIYLTRELSYWRKYVVYSEPYPVHDSERQLSIPEDQGWILIVNI